MTGLKMFRVVLGIVSWAIWAYKNICFASSNEGLEAFFALFVIFNDYKFQTVLAVLTMF